MQKVLIGDVLVLSVLTILVAIALMLQIQKIAEGVCEVIEYISILFCILLLIWFFVMYKNALTPVWIEGAEVKSGIFRSTVIRLSCTTSVTSHKTNIYAYFSQGEYLLIEDGRKRIRIQARRLCNTTKKDLLTIMKGHLHLKGDGLC